MEFRGDNEKELRLLREQLANVARQIEGTPWSKDFADKVEREIIPKEIYQALQKYREKTDSWLASHRNEIIAAGASIIYIVISIASGSQLSAAELATGAGSILPPIIDMTKRGENTHNAFHYLIKIKEMQTKHY
jgi:hypothetical protein